MSSLAILGAGHAGLRAARSAHEARFDGAVSVIDPDPAPQPIFTADQIAAMDLIWSQGVHDSHQQGCAGSHLGRWDHSALFLKKLI